MRICRLCSRLRKHCEPDPKDRSNAAVEKSGMTKYQKSGDGVYERVAGKGGPEHIFRK